MHSITVCDAQKFNNNQVFNVLSDTSDNIVTLNGNYFQNIQSLDIINTLTNSVAGQCKPTGVINSNTSLSQTFLVNTQPCKIKHQRWEASNALGTYSGNSLPFSYNQTCESGEPCRSPYTFVDGCPALIPNICQFVRVVAKLQSQPYCYAFNDLSWVNYTCGTNMYCNASKICTDARLDDCPSTITCSMTALPVGTYTIGGNVFIHAYPYPYIKNVSTASNWASNSSGVLRVSDGTLLTIEEIWMENTSFPYNYSILLNGMAAVNGIIPKLSYTAASTAQLQIAIDYGVGTTWLVPFAGNFVYYPKAIIYSVCPALAFSFTNSTVVVQGASFNNDPELFRCIYDNQEVPYIFLSSNVIQCIIFPVNNASANIPLVVTNDRVTHSDTTLFISILQCSIIKPNSKPLNNECACDAGYQDIGGACAACPDGSYQPLQGQMTCIFCDSTESTNGTVGNTDKSKCQCRDGRYREHPDDIQCTLCPEGLLCENGMVSVLPDYWRAESSNLYALPCDGFGCSGGSGGGNSICAEGYRGPLCNVCADGYGNIYGKCVACQSPSLNIFIVVVIVIAATAIVLTLTRYTTLPEEQLRKDKEGKEDWLIKMNTKFNMGMVMKIILSYMTILFEIGSFTSGWSNNSRQFFNIFIPVSISTNFISFKCAVPI